MPEPPHPVTAMPVNRTPIQALPGSGMSGLPALAALYRSQTRTSPGDKWQPQECVTQAHLLHGIEWLLRRDLATAEAEGPVLYVSTPDLPGAAPYSRYLPIDES